MKTVLISKEKLLDKIIKNRNKHQVEFVVAHVNWEKTVMETLRIALRKAENNVEFTTHFNIPEPVEHTDEYDVVISQIEWNEEGQIELDQQDFKRFILDDWEWKNTFDMKTHSILKPSK